MLNVAAVMQNQNKTNIVKGDIQIKMEPREFIDFLGVIEKLKCNTRHSWTSSGRRESVAEHTWRLAVMALLTKEDFPAIDNNKLIKMCLIHDLGEAITGDIPSFFKTDDHEKAEDEAIEKILSMLPEKTSKEFRALYDEMREMKSDEARLYKALDNMEAVVSHNEAPISTWIDMEYTENLIYGEKTAAAFDWTRKVREVLKEDSIKKIERESEKKE